MNNFEKDQLIEMISNYMENDFLESIRTLFIHDENLFELSGELFKDNRIKVRLGMTALFEELVELAPDKIKKALPSLKLALENESPTIRGDIAYIIGLIGGEESKSILLGLLNDPHPQVCEIVRDFIDGN